jgi:hypothetical protein
MEANFKIFKLFNLLFIIIKLFLYIELLKVGGAEPLSPLGILWPWLWLISLVKVQPYILKDIYAYCNIHNLTKQ